MAWTDRYVRSDAAGGGNGTTDTNSGANGAWTFAEGVTNEAAGMRLNVRSGTYASTTTNRTLAAAGTTTSPIWWRGFNATIGDCDTDPTLTKPALTWTTGHLVVSGAHHRLSNFNITSAATGSAAVVLSVANATLDRCRVENTGASTGAVSSSASVIVSRCWLKATSGAAAVATNSSAAIYRDCTFRGGGNGIAWTGGGGHAIARGCGFFSQGGSGISVSGLVPDLQVEDCSFYTPAANGISTNQLSSTSPFSICNCIFNSCGVYGINNSSGANTNFIYRSNNLFFNSGTADEFGFGDSPSLSQLADSASSFASASDLTPATTSTARLGASPGLFENESFTSYRDVGAVQVAGNSTDPGIANVKNGTTYTVNGAALTGTLVSTDPGIANVKNGTNYTIESIAKTGTLVSTDPGVANVKSGTAYTIESSAKTGTLVVPAPGGVGFRGGFTNG